MEMDRIAWIGQHEKQVWDIVAKIHTQSPKLFAYHDNEGDVSNILHHIRSAWCEGITDEEWFAATVKKLEEDLM